MGLEELGTFVEAVERGSLTAAGKTLGVPKSTVGRRITRLEEELGQDLLRRSARTFLLTEAGEALYRRARPAVRDLAEAIHLAHEGGSSAVGDLRLTVAVDIGSSAPFVRLCAEFAQAHPGVQLTIDLSDRRVDIVTEGFDLALRIHTGQLDDRTSLKVRRLGGLLLGLYASPSYLARAGRPLHPRELVRHQCIHTTLPSSAGGWTLSGPRRARPTTFPLGAGLASNSMGLVPPGVVVGAGIGLIPTFVGADLVTNGLAERVLPAWGVPGSTLSILWPASRQESRRLMAFIDYLSAHMALPK